MNTDHLIEKIHTDNALRRKDECRRSYRHAWRIAVPTAVAAAVVLILLLPHGNKVHAATPTGIYCNSQCNPDDVMTLIDNQINHIKTLKTT